MKINIDSLSYSELIELNQKVVERLKVLDSMHTHKEMMRFSPGDQVSFEAPGREKQFATLVKYNKKTVTVITESGEKWNISPHLIRKVNSVKAKKAKQGKILELYKK